MNIGMPLLFFDWVIGKICLFTVDVNVTSKNYFRLESKSFECIFNSSNTTKRCGKSNSPFGMRKFPLNPRQSFCVYVCLCILYIVCCFIHYYIYDIASNVRPIVYLFDVFLSDKFYQLNSKEFGSLYQTPQVGLGCIGTPLGYCGLVFAQLLSKPFVSFLLVSQDYFNSVNVFICHTAIIFIGKSTQKIPKSYSVGLRFMVI